MQLKGSYFLEGIKAKFLNHFKGEVLLSNNFNYHDNWAKTLQLEEIDEAKRKKIESEFEEKQNQFEGLTNWLSWFDTDREIEIPEIPNPILSVLNNLISRGEFTKPTLFIEGVFSQAFQKTVVQVEESSGNINSYLIDESRDFFNSVWTALHIIDTTPNCDDANKIKMGDQNSTFERWFISDCLNQQNVFFRQILQQQRALTSICVTEQQRGFKGNRVDFSVECPYYFPDEIPEYYWKKNFILKRRHGFILEIDGAPYHELAAQKIHDENRDEALKLAKWKVNRISSSSKVNDSTNAIETLLLSPFIQTTKKNFDFNNDERKFFSQIALSPIAIARVQKTLLRHLISIGDSLLEKAKYKIAIIERDVPCGYIAVDDLNEQIKNLSELKGENRIPKIEAMVFNDSSYSDSPLHRHEVFQSVNLKLADNDFDLIIDISVLRREGIFLDDCQFHSDKTIVIRSTNYQENTNEAILCSDAIKYKEIVKHKNDGTYEENETEKKLLTYFLQNIFRKNKFRIGQLPILNRALQLKSVIGLLPTGGGKSLTYQLAALLQPGITLVVDPIRSLMIDQFQNLTKTGIENCNFINSTLDTIERQRNISQLVKGEIQFCFISPERLVTHEFRSTLSACGDRRRYFSYCVIDEVHCVSEWGHDFRTPYLSLGKNARKYCPTFRKTECQLPLFGLTATASFDVLADVERELEILSNEVDDTIVSFENTLREEIQYSIIQTDINFQTHQLAREQRLNVWLNPNLKGNAYYANVQYFNPPHVDDVGNVIGDKPLKDEIGKRKQKEVIQILETEFLSKWHYYSDEKVQNALLEISFSQFLDEKQKEIFDKDEATYIESKKSDIIQKEEITPDNIWNENKNGFIIFAPHRTSYFGVTDKFKKDQNGNPIPVAKRHGIYDRILENYSAGIFMGSGDESDEKTSDEIQAESLKSQENFINSDIAVMVATKAFGMGIDKPNIRSTIHLNIPSSLESFVQESGRAGRDGKLAISFILFNQQRMKFFTPRTYRNLFAGNTKHGFERTPVRLADYATCLQLRNIANTNILVDKHRFLKSEFENILLNINHPLLDEHIPANEISNRDKLKAAAEEQWVDFDILKFFHYNSFRGVRKELVILNELLHEISFPQRQKLKEIEEEFFEETQIELKCNFSANPNFSRYIWINDSEGRTYGSLRTDTFNVSWEQDGGLEQAHSIMVLTQYKNFILQHRDFYALATNQERHDLLETMVMNPNKEGLIHAISTGETRLDIELKNRYYQTKNSKGSFISNTPWLLQLIQTLKNQFPEINVLPDIDIKDKFLNNVFRENQIHEPIESAEDLWNNIEKYYQSHPNFGQNYDVNLLHTPMREDALSKAFYCDRNSAETLKAIYRLMSIGIISDYEIDYRTKTVLLKFSTENIPANYRNNLCKYYRAKLKEFIRRYYSEVQSQKRIEQLVIPDENNIEQTITECLKVLIEFVYEETEEKRFQGIKEMVDAIEIGLPKQHEEPNEANKRFKEEIYYYFNAKYARKYVLPTGVSGNLVADTQRGQHSNFEVCKKYLRILREDRGAYLSNLKHMRGSSQKILRSVNQDNACLKILKAFSLYQLSQTQSYFKDEVLNPINGLFVTGFDSMFRELKWNLSELQAALDYLENECNRYFPDHRYKNEWAACRESIYLKHHNWWLTNFINRINTV
jgi:ATP-dependent DNA helicase RecQ